MHAHLKAIVTVLAIALITACSGDDDDDDDAQPPSEELEPLVITEDNAMEVASAVLAPLTLVAELGSTDGLLPIAELSALGQSESEMPFHELRGVADPTTHFTTMTKRKEVASSEGAMPELTEDCDVSGTVLVSVEIANEDGRFLLPGDNVTATFNRCNQGDVTIDGDLRAEVKSPLELDPETGLIPPCTADIEITFDLGLDSAGLQASVIGDLRSQSTGDGTACKTLVSGNELSFEFAGQLERLKTYKLETSRNDADGSYRIDARCPLGLCSELESSSLGGIVDFLSDLPFEGQGAEPPYSGILDIRGGRADDAIGRSTLATQALNSSCVELQLDTDGDGAIDWTLCTTWASLPDSVPDPCAC